MKIVSTSSARKLAAEYVVVEADGDGGMTELATLDDILGVVLGLGPFDETCVETGATDGDGALLAPFAGAGAANDTLFAAGASAGDFELAADLILEEGATSVFQGSTGSGSVMWGVVHEQREGGDKRNVS